ncbi:LexA family protein [Pseudomonas sp. NPDC087690]|uniref:LexA family protein n=1 Tax=Pseudomonas sp. NPDC087690 TaxID=3364446 RepID=UPI00381BA61B
MQADKGTYKFQRMSTLAERIKSARNHAKLTQKALALKVGVEQPVISQLETGKNLQSAHLPKIAHVCGVNAIWLSENIGPMIGGKIKDTNIGDTRQPVESFRYPVISWVAAGAWAEAVEPYPAGFSDRYEFSEYDSKGPAFWLTVKGDSMTAPAGQSITEGTLILVDTEAEVSPGKLVVAKLPDSNEATFKKLVNDGGRLFLKPLNPSYPIEPFDERCRIVGVVVRALQKFY